MLRRDMYINDISKKGVDIEKLKFCWALLGRNYLGHYREGLLAKANSNGTWMYVRIVSTTFPCDHTYPYLFIDIQNKADGGIFRHKDGYLIRQKDNWVTLEKLTEHDEIKVRRNEN